LYRCTKRVERQLCLYPYDVACTITALAGAAKRNIRGDVAHNDHLYMMHDDLAQEACNGGYLSVYRLGFYFYKNNLMFYRQVTRG
jgi:hypothetical protein